MATKKKTEAAETAVEAKEIGAVENESANKTMTASADDVQIGAEPNDEKIEQTVKKADEPRMYVGAALPGIPSNTIFKGTTPEKLNVPFVRELIIPVEDYPKFLQKKGVTTSREAFCYRKSAEYAAELKKNAAK